MTPEQQAEKYSEYVTQGIYETFKDFARDRQTARQAYLAGFNAASEWVKITDESSLPKKDASYLCLHKRGFAFVDIFITMGKSCAARWISEYTHYKPITPPQD